MNREFLSVMIFAMVLTISVIDSDAAKKEKGPVQVFLLVGQSNMEGKAHIRTPEILTYPEKSAMFRESLPDQVRQCNGVP